MQEPLKGWGGSPGSPVAATPADYKLGLSPNLKLPAAAASEADTYTVNPLTGVCVLCVEQRQGGSGYFGTVGGGYDWQSGDLESLAYSADALFGSISELIQDQTAFSVAKKSFRIVMRPACASVIASTGAAPR